MPPAPPLSALLPDLASPDDDHLRTALRSVRTALATASSDERSKLGDALLPLLERKSPRVREAVAHLADQLPPAVADAILAALLADGEHYVRRAAERASARRKGIKSAQAREDEEARVLGQILGRVEARAGKPGRRLAERAVQLAQEAFVRKLNHELTKAMMPLEFALHRIDGEASKPDVSGQLVHEHLARAREQVALSRSILAAAAACSSSITATFKEEALAGIVDDARRQLADRLGPRAAVLGFANDVDPKLRVEVDRLLLLQALQNILQNAAEAHLADAPRIEISVASAVQRRGAEIALSITDRGRGMSGEEISRAFIPFGSRKPGGTGVGMIVARRMVEEVHSGSLKLKSAPGVGTTVTIVLPVGERSARP